MVTVAMSRMNSGVLAVGKDVDLLGDVGANEQHGVSAVLAFDGVVAVAGIPQEHVVAGAEYRAVVAVVAEDDIVALTAEQHVVAGAADQDVVAVTAIDRELDARGRQPVALNTSSPRHR